MIPSRTGRSTAARSELAHGEQGQFHCEHRAAVGSAAPLGDNLTRYIQVGTGKLPGEVRDRSAHAAATDAESDRSSTGTNAVVLGGPTSRSPRCPVAWWTAGSGGTITLRWSSSALSPLNRSCHRVSLPRAAGLPARSSSAGRWWQDPGVTVHGATERHVRPTCSARSDGWRSPGLRPEPSAAVGREGSHPPRPRHPDGGKPHDRLTPRSTRLRKPDLCLGVSRNHVGHDPQRRTSEGASTWASGGAPARRRWTVLVAFDGRFEDPSNEGAAPQPGHGGEAPERASPQAISAG